MQTFAFLLAAGLTTAQVVFNNNTNQFVCTHPNANYCAGVSLGTDIIIRCDNASVGQPGRCTDNLAGRPPQGVNLAYCYQSSPTAGDAACEKNCIVYPEAPGSSPSPLPPSKCPQGGGSNTTGPPPTGTGIVPVGPPGSGSGGAGGSGSGGPGGSGRGGPGGSGSGGPGGSGSGGSGGSGSGGSGGSGSGGSGGSGAGGSATVPTAAAAFHGVSALAAAVGFAAFFLV